MMPMVPEVHPKQPLQFQQPRPLGLLLCWHPNEECRLHLVCLQNDQPEMRGPFIRRGFICNATLHTEEEYISSKQVIALSEIRDTLPNKQSRSLDSIAT